MVKGSARTKYSDSGTSPLIQFSSLLLALDGFIVSRHFLFEENRQLGYSSDPPQGHEEEYGGDSRGRVIDSPKVENKDLL